MSRKIRGYNKSSGLTNSRTYSLKVRGPSGGGSSSGTSRFDRSDSYRAEMFRRKYKIGQILKGRIVGPYAADLVLVEIDGEEFVARLATTRKIGENVRLLVSELYPEIILREYDPQNLGLNLKV